MLITDFIFPTFIWRRYDAYIKAAENFTASQAILTDKSTAAAEIDRVLTDCMTRARPVYLTLPTNLVYEEISADRLKIPLSRLPPPNDPDMEAFVLDEVVKLVETAANDVVILVDACTIRHDVREEVNALLAKTGYPVYSAPMGKTAVSETHESYGGASGGFVMLRRSRVNCVFCFLPDLCWVYQPS